MLAALLHQNWQKATHYSIQMQKNTPTA